MDTKSSMRGKMPPYDEAFKNTVCLEVLSGRLSYRQASRIYAIRGVWTVRKWVERYRQQAAKLNLQDMSITDPTPPDSAAGGNDLQKKYQQLEEALKMARLKITALETMIDVAESELNIDIRKKSGTKQQKN
jgi:transposase